VGTVVFSITGAYAALFAIDADDGELRFIGAPDFEAPADAGANNVYDIVIHANDGVFDTTRAVAITVGDVNDVAPTITSGPAAAVMENTAPSTIVYDANAADPDTVGTVVFSITGADAALFAIDADDGELRFIGAPDFEAPADAGANNVYDIVIHANDGVFDSTQAVAITVGDAAEDPNDNNNDPLGAPGNDTITGNGSANTLYGGAGDDVISAAGGNDTVYGGTGNDTINGGAGADLIYGGWGNDTISGADGNDSIYGGTGNDVINGQNGSDVLYGGLGNDTISGGANNDSVFGEAGNDTITGGAGTDILVGGDGSDTLTGNGGADTFRYLSVSNGGDTVTDFSRTQLDKIDLAQIDSGNGTDGVFAWGGTTPAVHGVWYQQVGGNTLLRCDTDGNTGTAEMLITLTGTGLGLTASDFIL
jgi:Ca2+-binding RTX toxin-like protein